MMQFIRDYHKQKEFWKWTQSHTNDEWLENIRQLEEEEMEGCNVHITQEFNKLVAQHKAKVGDLHLIYAFSSYDSLMGGEHCWGLWVVDHLANK
jgi:hypothetical protein